MGEWIKVSERLPDRNQGYIMREVMISIQPKWVEKIVSGEKTVEVRKTRPNCEVPFKCYIYCTQGKLKDLGIIGNEIYQKRMKVIGEFVCDAIIDIPHKDLAENFRRLTHDIITPSCLKVQELKDYLGCKDGYGWHITDLVVYDDPMELRDFKPYNRTEEDCKFSHLGLAIPKFKDCRECYVKRPYQSWGYVESTDPRQTAE